MKEHNKNFYSLEELKRTRDSLKGYLDNEEVYYFVGAIRYACDEIERLNNIISEFEKWVKEDTEKSMMTMETGRAFNMFDILDKIKELKGADKE